MTSDLSELIKVAIQAAKAAGKHALGEWGSRIHVDKETHHDVKLQTDIECEKIIVEILRKYSPHAILSEEAGLIKSVDNNDEYTWIIDPLDGSLNFLQGIPICCVSIAYYNGETAIFGIIYDFLNDILYKGIPNEGAWENDNRMTVQTQPREIQKSILATGIPSSSISHSDKISKQLITNSQNFRKIRLFGSAALSLVYLASARVDAYYEYGIKLWDVAAGIAIVLGAGGCVSCNRTNDLTYETITSAASNHKLLHEFQHTLSNS